MDDETLVMLGDMWLRRVQWLWEMCEVTSGRPVDIEWLDDQIIKEDPNAFQAPKG